MGTKWLERKNYGRNTCEHLKAVRKMIADANGINFHPHECTYEGECSGTCSACESEMRYIENELRSRKSIGKKIAVVGLAMGLSATPAFAQEPTTTESIQCEEELEGDVELEADEISIEDENLEDVPVCGFVEEDMPEFPGGDLALRKFIEENIRYPEARRCHNIEGVVYVSFMVDTLGNVSNVKVLRGLRPLFDAEAVRVVKTLPPFIPATRHNKAVSSSLIIPVRFDKKQNTSNKKSPKNKSSKN